MSSKNSKRTAALATTALPALPVPPTDTLSRASAGQVRTKTRAVVATAAAAALLIGAVGVAQASPPTPASGTVTQLAITGFEPLLEGPNVIFEQSTAGLVDGDLTGSYEDTLRVVIHPNGRFNAQGTLTCHCTVDGKSGVLEVAMTNTGQVLDGIPTFEGRYVIKHATDELSALRGVLGFEGTVDVGTGLSTITYSGHIHPHP